MKTSKLTGAALDWAVAKALDNSVRIVEGLTYLGFGAHCVRWIPSTNWTQGGPIIERERINVSEDDHPTLDWVAAVYDPQLGWYIRQYGPTPLIAAMRCCVEWKLGPEIEVPEPLV